MRKLLARKGVAAAAPGSGLTHHRIIIDADVVDQALAKLPTSLSVTEVISLTGIPKAILVRMIALGFLPTLTHSGNVTKAKHFLAREDVDALVERLFSDAEKVQAPNGSKITIRDARRVALASNDDLITWLLEGRLRWKGKFGETTNYCNLLIDADELKKLVRAEAGMSGLTQHEVCQLVPGLSSGAVPGLIELGALQAQEDFNPGTRRKLRPVTRESAEAFKAHYVSLGELCHTSGLSSRDVGKCLRLAGVNLAFPYEVARAQFFPRRPAWDALSTRST